MKRKLKPKQLFSGRAKLRNTLLLFFAVISIIIINPGCKTIYQPSFVNPIGADSLHTITIPSYYVTSSVVEKWLGYKHRHSITVTPYYLNKYMNLDSGSVLLVNILDKNKGYQVFPDTLNTVNDSIILPVGPGSVSKAPSISFINFSISDLELKINTLRRLLDSAKFNPKSDELIFQPFITMDAATKICYLNFELYLYSPSGTTFVNLPNKQGGVSSVMRSLRMPLTLSLQGSGSTAPVTPLNPSPPSLP